MIARRDAVLNCVQVQDSYYGQQEAKIGHFPSSVVEETHPLMPANTEVKTTVSKHTDTHWCNM